MREWIQAEKYDERFQSAFDDFIRSEVERRSKDSRRWCMVIPFIYNRY